MTNVMKESVLNNDNQLDNR